jgi:hypothetical protein
VSLLQKSSAIYFFLACFFAVVANAAPVTTQHTPSVPCAVVEKYGGDIEIMDSTRTHLMILNSKPQIPCGGWVSVAEGWVKLKHRDGYQIHMGPKTFAEIPEPNTDGHSVGDQVVLYKGEVFALAGTGTGEMRIATANARARMSRGSMIMIFTEGEEESQLIALENEAFLENKFQPTIKVKVNSGEASSLNFKLLRVVPSAPRAVAMSAIKPRLNFLKLDEQEKANAIRYVQRRGSRTLASVMFTEGQKDENGNTKKSNYARFNSKTKKGKNPITDNESNVYLSRRVAGGEEVGERILFPDKNYSKPRKAAVTVDDVGPKRAKEEESEKKKLIEELSHIQID